MALNEFVDFLDQNNMITKERITDDSDEGFSNRLRIQKYVFLSKYFGLKLPYNYNMHLNGPYSKNLSHDYYRIDSSNNNSNNNSNVLNSLDRDEFLNLIQEKSDGWLELATTILHKKGIIDDDVLLDHVAWVKCDFSNEEIEKVYSDLQGTILQ